MRKDPAEARWERQELCVLMELIDLLGFVGRFELHGIGRTSQYSQFDFFLKCIWPVRSLCFGGVAVGGSFHCRCNSDCYFCQQQEKMRKSPGIP